jgi:predicted DCC family thiol-disulfide oxidoreductase YuxK
MTPRMAAPDPTEAPRADPALTVLYDGACPLCRREIGLYRGLPASTPLCFADVSQPDQALPQGSTRAQLLARFHVLTAHGELLSGASAFVAMWATLPGWRWLARLARLPGVTWLMERAYRLFLRLRPRLQRWARRLDDRAAPPVAAAAPLSGPVVVDPSPPARAERQR